MSNKINVKSKIVELKKSFPEVKKVEIQYNGSGDSFEEFWDMTSTPESDIDIWNIEDLLWYAIDNSDADFNNDGSRGTIIIDFENKELSIDNYHITQSEEPSGIKIFR